MNSPIERILYDREADPVVRHIAEMTGDAGVWPRFSHALNELCLAVREMIYNAEARDLFRDPDAVVYREGLRSHRHGLKLEEAVDCSIGNFGIEAEGNNCVGQPILGHLIAPVGRRSPAERLRIVTDRYDQPSQLSALGLDTPISRALGRVGEESTRNALKRSVGETASFIEANASLISEPHRAALQARLHTFSEAVGEMDAWVDRGKALAEAALRSAPQR